MLRIIKTKFHLNTDNPRPRRSFHSDKTANIAFSSQRRDTSRSNSGAGPRGPQPCSSVDLRVVAGRTESREMHSSRSLLI